MVTFPNKWKVSSGTINPKQINKQTFKLVSFWSNLKKQLHCIAIYPIDALKAQSQNFLMVFFIIIKKLTYTLALKVVFQKYFQILLVLWHLSYESIAKHISNMYIHIKVMKYWNPGFNYWIIDDWLSVTFFRIFQPYMESPFQMKGA